jgi:hypothetical protein
MTVMCRIICTCYQFVILLGDKTELYNTFENIYIFSYLL